MPSVIESTRTEDMKHPLPAYYFNDARDHPLSNRDSYNWNMNVKGRVCLFQDIANFTCFVCFVSISEPCGETFLNACLRGLIKTLNVNTLAGLLFEGQC